MAKKVATKAVRIARGTALVLGVALMLALVLGVATTAVAGTGAGATFNLGQTNTVGVLSKLVGSVGGPSLQIDNNSTDAAATALDLQVEAGKAPMKINSSALVANLNADKVDGLNASQLGGLSGVEQVGAQGELNSTDIKTTSATCPEGKVAIGGGARMNGFINVAALGESHRDFGDPRRWVVRAHEPVPTDKEWELDAFAICASARP